MKIVAKTDVGMVRESNQDSYTTGELPNGVAWAVVCDGYGRCFRKKRGVIHSGKSNSRADYIFVQTRYECKIYQKYDGVCHKCRQHQRI